MAKLYPFLFFFLMLALQTGAQTPGDSTLPGQRVTAQPKGQDSLPLAGKPKRKLPKDSLIRHLPDSLRGLHVKVVTDSLRRIQLKRYADSLRRMRVVADTNFPRSLQGNLRSGFLREEQIPARTDSLRFSNSKPGLQHFPVSWMDLLRSNPCFNFGGNPVRAREEKYQAGSYDGLFYLLVGMLFFFAIIKRVFGKYLGNLLTLFFRVSMRQQQIREQVLQSPFPSLLLNLLFVLSGGLYASFLLQYGHFGSPDQFWDFFLYGLVILTAVYLVKFLFLKITGWIFNIKRAVEIYLFIVFMTNKIIGIFLLPFLVILSLSSHLVSSVCITGSAVLIGIFYIYRITASYHALRKEIKISGLHFFLYLCAFEIAPLLLIYKVLLTNLGKAN